MSRRNRAELEGVETSPDGRYIRFDEKLGSGAYKSVWLAYDTDLGIEVAWNTVDLKRLPEKEKIRLKSETDILKNLNHNCIINFYNSWENVECEQVIFTTEIVTSGTLKQYVSRFKPIKLKVIKKWCRQILQGLCYLHSKNPPIIHRDLKCDNIFINGSTGDIRIGDLGLSTMRNATHAASVLGTPEFMAPELYDEWYTEKVDVYAFGMVVLEMISNEYPYAECTNTAQIFKKVSAGIRPESLNRLQSSSTREFIELCLAKSNVRLEAEELAKHPFLDPRFVDYRERFPIPYDPIVTSNNSTPLVPVMELAAVAEHSQHSLERNAIKEDELDQGSESHDVSSLEVILENTVENIARVVLTLDLGTRRKEIKFPFDLDSDTAEAVAIEMVKELGLQQSSVNKLSDGIFAAIKDEKVKWNQTKVVMAQSRTATVVVDNFPAPSQTVPVLNSNLSVTNNTTPHSAAVLGSNIPSSFPPTNPVPGSLKPQPSLAPVNPALLSAPGPHTTAGVVPTLTNPAGLLSNVATDAPMIDPFTGTPLQQQTAPSHAESSPFPISEQTSFPGPAPQQPYPTPHSAAFPGPVQLSVQPAAQVSTPSFGGPSPTPTYTSHSASAATPTTGTLPKPTAQIHRAPSMPQSSLDTLLVSVSSLPNLQPPAVAPPSSFATNSYPPGGPSPLISAGSFTQTPPAIPFVAQPPSSFQSTSTTTGAVSSFGNHSYPAASSFASTVPSVYPNPSPTGTGLTANVLQMHLAPPPSQQQQLLQQQPQQQQVSGNAIGAQAAVIPPIGISVPSSQASFTQPSSQASVTMPANSSPGSQNPSVPTSQVMGQPSAPLALSRSESVSEAGRSELYPSGSPTGTQQPPVLTSPPPGPRFVKRRSIEEMRFSDGSSQESEALGTSNPTTNLDNATAQNNPKPLKHSPDQALDISNFLSGFDVSQLSPNQFSALRDLRTQLDESIRILKTQYAAMYREAVNKYKMEVVDNLTGWGFPIPPLNLKTQGLGSARGAQQGAPKSVNHLSRRTRDVISLAHGSSNDLMSLESNPSYVNQSGPVFQSSLPTVPAQNADSSPDHIYNRLIQPFAPAEANSDPNGIHEVNKSTNNLLGLVPGPGPSWPPKIDTLDPSIWDPSSQSPSS